MTKNAVKTKYCAMDRTAAYASRACLAILILVCCCFFAGPLFPVALASELYDELVPSSLISINHNNAPAYAILVEKTTQTALLYEYKDGIRLKHHFVCSTGEASGKKEKAGDRKTPEGIYFFTKSFKKRDLSPIYGNMAFVMDYPNLLDRQLGRGGNNIWLHGSNKPIKSRDSNGCVVTKNHDIEKLAQYIDLNRTPIIIKEKLKMVPATSQLADKESLERFISACTKALVTGDREGYLDCYDKASTDIDTLWEEWDNIRNRWQESQTPFNIRMQNLTLARGNPCVVALFDQVVEMNGKVIKAGAKKLFLEGDGTTWKIVAEGYQPTDTNGDNRPLLAALNRLERFRTDQKTIADLVSAWASAWSSKEIDRYASFYSPDFHSRGMNLKRWISYKDGLNARYNSIRISIEDLKVEQGFERSTATFVQLYESSGHHSVGRKKLRLKRIGETWKIYRETFNPIQR